MTETQEWSAAAFDSLGTEWVKMGKGDSFGTLLAAANNFQKTGHQYPITPRNYTEETNLLIIGPLTPYDLDRIRHVEVKAGPRCC